MKVFLLALILSPAVLLGMVIGMKVYYKMNEVTVKKSVVAMLIASGTVLFLKNLLSH